MTVIAHHQKEQKTVLLPTFRFIIPSFPYFNIYSYIKMPPLGIMSVAKAVDRMGEFKVEVIDENNYNGHLDHVKLQKEKPAKYVGFYGGLTSTIPRLLKVAEIYKNNGATVIAGGNHVDVKSEETLSGSAIDIIVNGEGEITIQDLLKTIESNNDLSGIDGITYKIDDKIVKTKRRPPIENLEQIEPPDFTLLHNLPKPLKYIPLNLTRGCNHVCEFCIVKHHLGRSRSFPVKTILNEYLKYCDMGIREFFFTDDNFVQFPDKTKQLCEGIIEHRSKMKKKSEMTVQVRVDSAENTELLKIMREAGVKTLCIGYESPLEEELINMKKNLTVESQKNYTKILKKEGFYIHGMFIFGYPTFLHSKKKVDLPLKQRAKKYLQFIKKNKIDTVQILLPVPIPGTKLESKLNDEGRLFPTEIVTWDKYDGNWLCFSPDKGLSPKEFQYWGNWVMKKFYNLRNIFKFLFKIPNSFSLSPLKLSINFFNDLWKHKMEIFFFSISFKNIYQKKTKIWLYIKKYLRLYRDNITASCRNFKWHFFGYILIKMWRKKFIKEDFYSTIDRALNYLKIPRKNVQNKSEVMKL